MKIIIVGDSSVSLACREQLKTFAQENRLRITYIEEEELIQKLSPPVPAPLDLKSFPELTREIPIVKFSGEKVLSNRALRRSKLKRKK